MAETGLRGALTRVLGALRMPDEQRAITPAQVWGADADFWDTDRNPSGERVTQRSATALAAVYACQTLIADTVSTLPVGAYRKRNGLPVPLEPEPAWLTTPIPNDPSVTRAGHFSQVAMSLLTDGNAFIHATPSVHDPVVLTVIDPRYVTIDRARGLRPVYKVRGSRGQDGEYGIDEIIHIPRTVRPGEARGMSPIDEEAMTLGTFVAATKHAGRFYRNGALLATVIEAPGEMSEEDAKALRDGFDKAHSGDNVFKTGVLTGGAHAVTLGVTPEQALFLETIKHGAVEVCRIFRVPPMLAGVNEPGAVSYASSVEAVKVFAQTLRTFVDPIELGYRRLLDGDDAYLRFDLEGLKRADPEARYAGYAIGLEKGFLNRDEVRGWEELPPIGGKAGKLYTVQAQMTDLATVADPPPPPPQLAPFTGGSPAPKGGASEPPFPPKEEPRYRAGQARVPRGSPGGGRFAGGAGGGTSGEAAGLQARAKEVFGVTDDIREAGYVTPDGTMLDFSGRHYSTGYHREGDRFVVDKGEDYLRGSRVVDHREVGDLVPEDVHGGEERMRYLINAGFVRVMAFPSDMGLEINQPLTDGQMRSLVRASRGIPSTTVDVADATGRITAMFSNFSKVGVPNATILRQASEAAAEKRYRADQPRGKGGKWIAVGGGGGGSGSLAYTGLAAAAAGGGFSVTIHGAAPHSGFMVSPYKDAERAIKVGDFDREAVHRYRDEHQALLRKSNHYLGAWREGDLIYLDVSVHADTPERAAAIARQASQIAFYDIGTGQTVYTADVGAAA